MRLWRLKQGLRWTLRCRALPRKTREVLVRHTTFVALPRRDVPSVPFANYSDSARLWPSARAEVQASDGPVNERNSANAIPTLLVHARRSLINIGSDLILVVT